MKMRIAKGIWLFYRKLILSALIISLAFAFLVALLTGSNFSFNFVGIAYIFFAPLFHYFIYEVRNVNEYYFYHNIGLSRLSLWISTLAISIGIGLIFLIV